MTDIHTEEGELNFGFNFVFSKYFLIQLNFNIRLTHDFYFTDQDLDQKSALEKDLAKEVTGIQKTTVGATAVDITTIVGVTVGQDLVAGIGGDPDQDPENVGGGQEAIAEKGRGLLT